MATASAVNVTDGPLTYDGEGHVLAGGERGSVDTSLPSVQAAVLRGALLVDPRVEKRIRERAAREAAGEDATTDVESDADVDEDPTEPAVVVVEPKPAPRSSKPRRAAAQPAETTAAPAPTGEAVIDHAGEPAQTTDEVSA